MNSSDIDASSGEMLEEVELLEDAKVIPWMGHEKVLSCTWGVHATP